MRSNPFCDPFVEAGYLRHSLRAIAHQQHSGTYRPSLEIRDYRDASGDLLYQCLFQELFSNADDALDWAMGIGQKIVNDWAEPMNPAARAPLALPLH